MGGFQNELLNKNFKQSFYHTIIAALIAGCRLMVKDCFEHHVTIQNHEEKIRTHLLENYLENSNTRRLLGLDGVPVRFIAEVPENYDSTTDTYFGRTDIRVVSSNWFRNREDYYIIECKRIDGTLTLNKKYVEEGICRFIGETPKYSSYNNRNIMLGFVVKNMDCTIVIRAITDIHTEKIGSIIVKDITLVEDFEEYCCCESVYTGGMSLDHIFYNISSIISS